MLQDNNVFKQFYDDLNDKRKRDLREKITQDLEISEVNFYWRLRNCKWKALEKVAIAKIAKRPVTKLFPEAAPALI